jgi:hypothetical protein
LDARAHYNKDGYEKEVPIGRQISLQQGWAQVRRSYWTLELITTRMGTRKKFPLDVRSHYNKDGHK